MSNEDQNKSESEKPEPPKMTLETAGKSALIVDSNQMKSAVIVPLHATMGPIRRTPGGRRKIDPRPIGDDLTYQIEIQRQQDAFVANDELVKAIRERRDTATVLHLLKEKAAVAAATLEFQRSEMQKYGKSGEAAQTVSRQVGVIREIASLELELSRKSDQVIDVRSEKIQKIFALFVERIQAVASATLPPEVLDLFFTRLETALSGWEDEAESRLR